MRGRIGEMWKSVETTSKSTSILLTTCRFHRSMTRPFFTRERISDFEIYHRNCDLSLRNAKQRLAEGHPVDFQARVEPHIIHQFPTNIPLGSRISLHSRLGHRISLREQCWIPAGRHPLSSLAGREKSELILRSPIDEVCQGVR
jgi:hypothetical protein